MKRYLVNIVSIITLGVHCSSILAHPGWGIEHDSKGNLFFTDIVNKTIWKLDNDGKLSAFSKEKWSHQLFIDNNDNIYICNEEYKIGNGWNSLIKISPDGYESYIIPPTKRGIEFSGTLIAIDDSENVYYEYDNNVYKRTSEGKYSLYVTENFNSISNLDFLNSNLYVVSREEIFQVDRNKNLSVIAKDFINSNPIDGAYEGRYNMVAGIDIDDEGNLVLAYYGNSRVLKILKDGTIKEIYFAEGDWYPMGVEYNDNNLYILEEGHAQGDGPTALRVMKITDNGMTDILVALGHIGGKSVNYEKIEVEKDRY